MKNLISIEDLSKAEILKILDKAEEFEDVALGKRKLRILEGKILANLFFEPSTRTRMSFEAAMKRLGGDVINLTAQEASSIAKGETLADTIKVVSKYCDAIVIRHPLIGAARFAAEHSDVPIINAGDGAGQHPTQTLLDLYTIRKECGKLSGISIALVGDLRYSRTVHSLIKALNLFDAEIYLVSPPTLSLPEEILDEVPNTKIADLSEVITAVDVLYVTRIQRERFPDEEEYKKVANSYKITPDLLINAKDTLIILHPLPRVNEIDTAVDKTKHARYFEQAFYGVPVRMAILTEVIK
ncbi:MAG: aspartate carbamoyltransferase [Archaeoglobales archaeon]|nr:aspartate carbamoyltransferase [Archaeoglobales archaeon]